MLETNYQEYKKRSSMNNGYDFMLTHTVGQDQWQCIFTSQIPQSSFYTVALPTWFSFYIN